MTKADRPHHGLSKRHAECPARTASAIVAIFASELLALDGAPAFILAACWSELDRLDCTERRTLLLQSFELTPERAFHKRLRRGEILREISFSAAEFRESCRDKGGCGSPAPCPTEKA